MNKPERCDLDCCDPLCAGGNCSCTIDLITPCTFVHVGELCPDDCVPDPSLCYFRSIKNA